MFPSSSICTVKVSASPFPVLGSSFSNRSTIFSAYTASISWYSSSLRASSCSWVVMPRSARICSKIFSKSSEVTLVMRSMGRTVTSTA